MRHERGGRGDFTPRNFAPVKVGDEFDAKIEAVGEKGDGIAKKDGFVLFVPGTKQGEEVRIRVTRVLQKVGFAEVAGSKSSDSEETEEQGHEQPEETESSEGGEDYQATDTEDFGEEGNQ